MKIPGFRKNTTLMIYAGTFLISILSFFTTFYGLAILVDKTLALIGSLGLQIALLGIAWNLIRIKENRSQAQHKKYPHDRFQPPFSCVHPFHFDPPSLDERARLKARPISRAFGCHLITKSKTGRHGPVKRL